MGDLLSGGGQLFLLGAGSVVAAVILFVMRKENATFPIVLLIGGIFMCAAQRVSASLPGGISLDFQKEVVSATDEIGKSLEAQKSVINALADSVGAMQTSFADYQKAVNQRFDTLQATPVAAPDPGDIKDKQDLVLSRLRTLQIQQSSVAAANNRLKQAVPAEALKR